MSPVMRYTVIRHKDAIARKAAGHYNIKTGAAFAAVLALAIGPLTSTVTDIVDSIENPTRAPSGDRA